MHFRASILVLLVAAHIGPASASEVIHVDVTNASDPLQDGSAQHPFDSIQEGIVEANAGDAVLVMPGIYFEAINFLGKSIEVRSRDGSTTTILDAGELNSCVTFESAEGPASVLRGLQLRNGANVTGGGVRIEAASPTIVDNHIHHNVAHFGGGIDVDRGNPLILRNIVEDNIASDFDDLRHIVGDGGGISFFRSSGLAINNIVRRNWCERRGGGIAIEGDTETPAGSVTCAGNLIYGNHADGLGGNAGGGGISIRSNVFASLHAETITENTAPLCDGVHVTFPDAIATFDSCIIYGNGTSALPEVRVDLAGTASFQYCDIGGGQAGVQTASLGSATFGSGILDLDPFFSAPTADNYALAPCSPLVNLGNPGYAPQPDETSLDGGPRVSGSRVDIGAYELGYSDCNANTVADACDIASGASLDKNNDGIPDECGGACPGDVNGDNVVNLTDLATLLTYFGTAGGATREQGDLDADGDVDLTDLATLLSHFGASC